MSVTFGFAMPAAWSLPNTSSAENLQNTSSMTAFNFLRLVDLSDVVLNRSSASSSGFSRIRVKISHFPFILQSQNNGPNTSSAKRPVGVDGGMLSTSKCRRWSTIVSVVHWKAHPFCHTFKHANIESTSLASSTATDDGRENVIVSGRSSRNICYTNARLCRRTGRACDEKKS